MSSKPSKMVLCGHCAKPVHNDYFVQHLKTVHGIELPTKSVNLDKFPEAESGGQPRFEGGFRWVQGGGPGSRQR